MHGVLVGVSVLLGVLELVKGCYGTVRSSRSVVSFLVQRGKEGGGKVEGKGGKMELIDDR